MNGFMLTQVGTVKASVFSDSCFSPALPLFARGGRGGSAKGPEPGYLEPSECKHVFMCDTVTCLHTGARANLATAMITTSESSRIMHQCGIIPFDVDCIRKATSRVVPPTSISQPAGGGIHT